MAGDSLSFSFGSNTSDFPWTSGPNTFYPTATNWTWGHTTTTPPPGVPAPTYQFNIVILSNGQRLPLDSDDLAAKIGQAIAAAFQTREDQHTLEDLAE